MIRDRITLDIDGYIDNMGIVALRAHSALTRMDAVESVDVYVSTGGRGIHLDAALNERLSAAQRQEIRHTLGDDPARTRLDTERGQVGHATDIFWTEKAGNDGDRRHVSSIWAALDCIERSRAPDSARVKALAQHGRKAVWDTHGINRASMADPR